MKTTEEQQAFLSTVCSLNDRWDAVRAGSANVSLCHSFWSEAEIEAGRKVQANWDVPDQLVPFYGDWHDLICLNINDGAIEMVDDGRRRVFTWPSLDEFVNCLMADTQSSADTSGIIDSESWLDF